MNFQRNVGKIHQIHAYLSKSSGFSGNILRSSGLLAALFLRIGKYSADNSGRRSQISEFRLEKRIFFKYFWGFYGNLSAPLQFLRLLRGFHGKKSAPGTNLCKFSLSLQEKVEVYRNYQ